MIGKVFLLTNATSLPFLLKAGFTGNQFSVFTVLMEEIKMWHVVQFSGGTASWGAAKLVAEKYGTKKLILLFADTLIEDQDNYRFILEGAAHLFGFKVNPEYVGKGFLNIPEISLDEGEMVLRESVLWRLRDDCQQISTDSFPDKDGYLLRNGLHMIGAVDRDPWDVFTEKRWLSDRGSVCSKELKQKACRTWIQQRFNPDECTLYVGIDFNEAERMEGINRGWSPYHVESPLLWGNWTGRHEINSWLEEAEIEQPRLYKLGFSHSNCGGFCVKAGKGQFRQLLNAFPERYAYHEAKEKQFQEKVETDVTILKEQHNNELQRLSLKEWRERQRSQLSLFDETDLAWGGCGCFIDFE